MNIDISIEQDLKHKIAGGDEKAFGRLFDMFWKKVYAISLTYLKNAAAAEDATQDIFLKLWKAREKLSEVDSLDNYLFIITRNQLLHLLRKKNPAYQALPFTNSVEPQEEAGPEKSVSYKELQQQLHKAIELLPQQQQMALKLSREEGLSHEEIANIMGLSKHTVKNHIIKGLNTVRQYLHQHAQPLAMLVFWIYSDFFEK